MVRWADDADLGRDRLFCLLANNSCWLNAVSVPLYVIVLWGHDAKLACGTAWHTASGPGSIKGEGSVDALSSGALRSPKEVNDRVPDATRARRAGNRGSYCCRTLDRQRVG